MSCSYVIMILNYLTSLKNVDITVVQYCLLSAEPYSMFGQSAFCYISPCLKAPH